MLIFHCSEITPKELLWGFIEHFDPLLCLIFFINSVAITLFIQILKRNHFNDYQSISNLPIDILFPLILLYFRSI